ncbi:hypothetical protein P7H00_03450 [Enterococcus pseudoavium]|uniref:Uncharacterized protein n=1 Tax=Enterococcus pseudoavium TaxID=44007 RepID=A0AAE4HYJ8_9ENTE|nr:hypothetical protein [Enterococcus pseudoavium]MDT2736194.1 hypothetical protein [Enterococcus pseudoavium]MDT2753322.1 hypothetical protein [Enterococcus pseudoavium]MDT2770559.1 hypothetical protein [Enterococcus pseudoavium]REC32194.1 hypothetical protein CF160_06940 [Enterococcus pseudoavium]
MRPNTGFYAREINEIVQNTEKMGERLHPSYEELRSALDEKKLAEFDQEHLSEIHELFKEGTEFYRLNLEKIAMLKAPAKVMGNHKRFEKAYIQYVAGCQEMTDSLLPQINEEAFNAAEQKQDEATDTIYKTIQKITNLLLK